MQPIPLPISHSSLAPVSTHHHKAHAFTAKNNRLQMHRETKQNAEEQLDESIDKEMNNWRKGFHQSANAPQLFTQPHPPTSARTYKADSNPAYLTHAPNKQATAVTTTATNTATIAQRTESVSPLGTVVKHWPYPVDADNQHTIPELIGPHGVLFPPVQTKAKNRSTQTEKWGDYSQAVSRIQSLGEQIQHLYNINSELDENLQCAQRIIQEMQSERQISSQKETETVKEYGQMKDSYGKQIERIQDLLDDNVDLKETVHDMQLTLNHNSQHMSSQTNVINKLLEEKNSLTQKIHALEHTVDHHKQEHAKSLSDLADMRRVVDTSNQQLTNTHALLQVANNRLQVEKVQYDDCRSSLQSSQRLLDEHIRQNALDRAHLEQKWKASEDRVKQAEKKTEELQTEISRLQPFEAKYMQLEADVNPRAAQARLKLSRAQEVIDFFEGENRRLANIIVTREKMINDMLTSDSYKDEMRTAYRDDLKKQALAREEFQKQYALQQKRLRGEDEPDLCTIQ